MTKKVEKRTSEWILIYRVPCGSRWTSLASAPKCLKRHDSAKQLNIAFQLFYKNVFGEARGHFIAAIYRTDNALAFFRETMVRV